MRSREDAARRFAELMPRWRYLDAAYNRKCGYRDGRGRFSAPQPFGDIWIPKPDDPLHEQTAVFGYVAEAVGCAQPSLAWGPEGEAIVSLSHDTWGAHRDLVHAALLAGVAALEEKGGTKP